MKTQIIIILGILISINLAFALDINAGQNVSFTVPTINQVYYEVVGNQSNIEGFLIYQDVYADYSNITLVIDYRFKSDSFTLILFEEKTNEVIIEVPVSSGGSSGTRTIYKNNTIYLPSNEKEYLLKEVPTYITNETIKLVDDEKIIEVFKPFYKDIWFYILIIVVIIGIIFLIRERSEYGNQM